MLRISFNFQKKHWSCFVVISLDTYSLDLVSFSMLFSLDNVLVSSSAVYIVSVFHVSIFFSLYKGPECKIWLDFLFLN